MAMQTDGLEIYPRLVRWSHWATAILLLPAFVLIIWATSIPFTPLGDTLTNWHRTLGIAVWLMAVPRVSWRIFYGPPAADPSLPPWQERIAAATHWLLAILLILQPILGYLDSNLWNVPVKLFDRLALPALVAEQKPLNEYVDLAHVWLGWFMLGLIGLHSAAALHHHFWLKDGVMRRMLPARRPA